MALGLLEEPTSALLSKTARGVVSQCLWEMSNPHRISWIMQAKIFRGCSPELWFAPWIVTTAIRFPSLLKD